MSKEVTRWLMATREVESKFLRELKAKRPLKFDVTENKRIQLEAQVSGFTDDAATRKGFPVYSGFVKYFPLAMGAVAKLSAEGNEQHNPGQPLHWDRSKSGDEKDAMMRHIIDGDWVHVAWRAMANLEKELEDGQS